MQVIAHTAGLFRRAAILISLVAALRLSFGIDALTGTVFILDDQEDLRQGQRNRVSYIIVNSLRQNLWCDGQEAVITKRHHKSCSIEFGCFWGGLLDSCQ